MTKKDPEARGVQNTFLFFLHAVLLLLSGIAVFAHIKGYIDATPWILPKTMELKIYAVIVSAGAAGTWAGRNYLGSFLQKDRTFYTFFWCIALPALVILNTGFIEETRRSNALFLIAILGGIILCVETLNRKKWHLKISDGCFPFSVCLSVALIFLLSHQNTFDPISLLGAALFCGLACSLATPRKAALQWQDLPLGLCISTLLFFLVAHQSSVSPVWAIVWIAAFSALLLTFQKTQPRWGDIPVLSLFLLFVFFSFFSGSINVRHYSFYLGPVVEMWYGHKHPFVELNAQYGAGVTVFLTAWLQLWGHVANEGVVLLLRLLAVAQYVVMYSVARSLLGSKLLALCTLFAMLVFCAFSQSIDLFAYPSTGALRFGHIFLILLLYTIPLGKNGNILRMNACALIAGIATLWSFESFVYTVPAWMAAEVWSGRGKSAITHYTAYTASLLILFILPPLLHGEHVDLYRYIEFSAAYAGGVGQIRLDTLTNLWWLFPALYLLIVMEVLWKKERDVRVLMLAIYGLGIFTYFCGRAHPNNLHHIALPFILLGVYWLERSALPWKKMAISGFLTTLVTANFSYFDKGMITWSLMNTWSRLSIPTLQSLLPASIDPAMCATQSAILNPYIYHHSLALIDDNVDLYMLYDCLQISNALDADPWLQVGVSPRAIARLQRRAAHLQNPYILVADTMLQDPLAVDVLGITHAQKITEFQTKGAHILVYRNAAIRPGEPQPQTH